MSVQQPGIGDWYRLRGGEIFEVVAVDEKGETVEVQYFDGTLEEIELADWQSQCGSGAIQDADPPEDWSGSVDVEPEDERSGRGPMNEDGQLRASPLDDLDIFE
jgi:hypothetical protein